MIDVPVCKTFQESIVVVQILEHRKFIPTLLNREADLDDVSLACWSLVHGLASLIVDGRLAEEDAGSAEAVARRLTWLMSDALAALGGAASGGTGSITTKHSPRRRQSAKKANSIAG